MKKFCFQINRKKIDRCTLLKPIRNFISELRHAHVHPDTSSQFIWDKGKNNKKKPFQFRIVLPVSKTLNGAFYSHDSKDKFEFSIEGIPGKELELTQNFLEELILFSYHIRKLFTISDSSILDNFLETHESNWISL